jgi:hypothetical protein
MPIIFEEFGEMFCGLVNRDQEERVPANSLDATYMEKNWEKACAAIRASATRTCNGMF